MLASSELSWVDQQRADPEIARLHEQERLLIWVTEEICEYMDSAGLSRADLARRLGTSRANVSQLLSGERNLTLRSVADIAWACDARVKIQLHALRGPSLRRFTARSTALRETTAGRSGWVCLREPRVERAGVQSDEKKRQPSCTAQLAA
jgi:transcriptional regulator with XRE-family HTH domain